MVGLKNIIQETTTNLRRLRGGSLVQDTEGELGVQQQSHLDRLRWFTVRGVTSDVPLLKTWVSL